MMLRLVTLTAFGLAAALPSVASAHDGDEGRPVPVRGAGDCEERDRVWVKGHDELREVRRVVPAVVRQEWVPDRYERVVVPAVTETVRIPAVTTRVYCPAVVERVWVPEAAQRCFVPGRSEYRVGADGCVRRVWIEAHFEVRVIRAGRFEERVVKAACWEDRVVQAERCEVRVIVPERCEVRLVEKRHFATVVVRPERCDVVVERVWVPGHWESRRTRTDC